VVGDDADGIVYEFGTFAFDGPASFQVSLTRQSTRPDVDEDENLDQLRCVLHYPVTAETSAFGRATGGGSSMAMSRGSHFAAEVESQPESITLRDVRPARSEVEQRPV
jgi:hypothetical protein